MTSREFERLAREQREMLIAYARKSARRHNDAEDAVQEALTSTFARHELIRRETAVAYIAVAARHAAVHLGRQAERTDSLEQVTHGAPSGLELIADPRAADPDTTLDVLAALRALKRDQARALLARMLGWSYREIGDAFGWSHTKTNRSIREGRARLRKLLAADDAAGAPPSSDGHGGLPRPLAAGAGSRAARRAQPPPASVGDRQAA